MPHRVRVILLGGNFAIAIYHKVYIVIHCLLLPSTCRVQLCEMAAINSAPPYNKGGRSRLVLLYADWCTDLGGKDSFKWKQTKLQQRLSCNLGNLHSVADCNR